MYMHNNTFALFQNESNLLKGLYGFKQFETFEEPKEQKAEYVGKVQHEYSHISLKAKVYTCEVAKKTIWYLVYFRADKCLSFK